MFSYELRAMVGLLKLIDGFGGHIEGRIRIQKAAFLLGCKGVDYFDPADFVYHHYGPYNRALSDTLHQAVSFELVEEHRDSFAEDSARYTYRITDKGRAFLASIADNPRVDMGAMAQPISSHHWRTLELAATIAFLEQHGEAESRRDAFNKAVHLKPACSNFVDEARQLLGAVGI